MTQTKNDIAVIKIINKMLEKYNVDYDYVCKNPTIENEPWYQFYTMTASEYEIWKKWSITLIRKTLKEKKMIAERSFAMLDLYCGLKIKEDDVTDPE